MAPLSKRVILLFTAIVLAVAVFYPVNSYGVKYELVQFDPNWQPPPGVFSGGRSQATGMIMSEIRSNFGFAGSTIRVVSQVGATNAGDQVNTIRYLPSNSTSFIGRRMGRSYTSACYGCNWPSRPATGFVFGSQFNDPAFNNSSAYARAAGQTGAHEAGHGLNASHTTIMTEKMKDGSTPGQKAGTKRHFSPGNQERMTSAVRAGGSHPATGGKESVTLVFSHDELGRDPLETLEDPFTMVVEFVNSNSAWQLGYMNDVGEFTPLTALPTGTFQLKGGRSFEFAVRNVMDPSQVFTLSASGAAIMSGMLQDPANALVPLMSDPYFSQVMMDFLTPMGPVHMELYAQGTNGFAKIPQVIPTLQYWGMILLLLILMGFAIYRLRVHACKAKAY